MREHWTASSEITTSFLKRRNHWNAEQYNNIQQNFNLDILLVQLFLRRGLPLLYHYIYFSSNHDVFVSYLSFLNIILVFIKRNQMYTQQQKMVEFLPFLNKKCHDYNKMLPIVS